MSSPIQIMGLDHVVLRVRELEPMLHFYCDVLGCSEERRVGSANLVQLRAGACLIDLICPASHDRDASSPPVHTNMDHFCIRLERFDVQAIRWHLEMHGVRAGEVAARYGAEGSGPSIYVHDPEGNVVELKGPPSMATPRPAPASRR